MRWIGVDWSGRRDPRAHLWVAEHDGDRITDLDAGRDRCEVVDHLLARAHEDASLLVGLDFSFGLPAWFSPEGGPGLWERARVEGERWLAECPWPFWGRPGRPRPDTPQWRATELELRRHGHPAKSTFQIGGAGAVGTGSIRGWPALRALRAAGFSIWPFDPPVLPLVVEVYPRVCTGPVVKSRPAARAAWLATHELPADAALTEDAFDAVAVAAALPHMQPPSTTCPMAAVEGWVWTPATL